MSNAVVGILGGGQLGRMFLLNALRYPLSFRVLDPNSEAPCAGLAHHFIQGDFNDYDTVVSFGRECTHLTIEIERVNTKALETLAKSGVEVVPRPHIIRTIQDKGLQKQFYTQHNLPTSPYACVSYSGKEELDESLFPAFIKMREGGYDGKGVEYAQTPSDITFRGEILIEKKVDIKHELSVLCARNAKGEMAFYDPVELVFDDALNLVDYLLAPARIDNALRDNVLSVARHTMQAVDSPGFFAIEFFVSTAGDVLVNEMAPRTHNSGHHTIEAAACSQFDQHLRMVMNWPTGSTALFQPAGMMNWIGDTGTGTPHYEGMEEVLDHGRAAVHQYGKAVTRPGRKMGHVTVLGKTVEEVETYIKQVKPKLKVNA